MQAMWGYWAPPLERSKLVTISYAGNHCFKYKLNLLEGSQENFNYEVEFCPIEVPVTTKLKSLSFVCKEFLYNLMKHIIIMKQTCYNFSALYLITKQNAFNTTQFLLDGFQQNKFKLFF